MAYRKRGYKKRRVQKRRVPGWGGAIGRVAKVGMGYVSKGGIAYKALNLARKVADAVNTEYKHFDVFATQQVSWSGYFPTINNAIPQGTADGQRIGDSIKNQRFILRGDLYRGSADAVVRIILLWDPQCKVSGVSDVLQSINSVYSPVSPKTYDKRFQTKVLKDFLVKVTSNDPIKKITMNVPINEHTQFDVGTTTQDTGRLMLLVISDKDPATPANEPTFIYFSRLTYTDN